MGQVGMGRVRGRFLPTKILRSSQLTWVPKSARMVLDQGGRVVEEVEVEVEDWESSWIR